VVLGRPVFFVDDDAEADAAGERQLEAAARAAGFERIAFQFEPIAAALDYEQSVNAEEIALVADIGGGTSNFSVAKPAIDPVLKAGIAHPFDDGNGRIARAIADVALARSEASPQRFYSMSAQIRLERSAYYDILEATQKADLDITRWLSWFLGCLNRAFDGAEVILTGVLKTARFWEKHAGAAFNDRQRDMLGRLLGDFEGKLTSSKWAKIEKCSQDTALRDIADLVKRRVLKKDEGGGRSTSYSLVEAG
jgi:Fic family protein